MGKWSVVAAVAVALILIIGLAHDFTAPAGQQWLTTRPAAVGTLLLLGYAAMFMQRYASRRAARGAGGEEEE